MTKITYTSQVELPRNKSGKLLPTDDQRRSNDRLTLFVWRGRSFNDSEFIVSTNNYQSALRQINRKQ